MAVPRALREKVALLWPHLTITKGLAELEEPPLPPGRVRHPGGGRRALVDHDLDLPRRLEALVEPLTRGDPESPVALDEQEHARVGYRPDRPTPSDQPRKGRPVCCGS